MKSRIEIGVLYSRSGSYQLVANACHAGTMRAVADINADPTSGIEFVAMPNWVVSFYFPRCVFE